MLLLSYCIYFPKAFIQNQWNTVVEKCHVKMIFLFGNSTVQPPLPQKTHTILYIFSKGTQARTKNVWSFAAPQKWCSISFTGGDNFVTELYARQPEIMRYINGRSIYAVFPLSVLYCGLDNLSICCPHVASLFPLAINIHNAA